MKMEYSIKKQLNVSYEEAIEKVKVALKEEGFGVLTEIDVKATLKKKMDIDFDKYLILGACNPSFAYQALQSEYEIGLFLPCNIIIYEIKGKTYISAIDPVITMKFVDNPKLGSIAKEVKTKLISVIHNV